MYDLHSDIIKNIAPADPKPAEKVQEHFKNLKLLEKEWEEFKKKFEIKCGDLFDGNKSAMNEYFKKKFV